MANEMVSFPTLKSCPALPPDLKKRIRIEWDSGFDNPLSAEHSLYGKELIEATAILEDHLRPCGASFALPLLTALKATQSQRNRDDTDMKAWALVMLSEIGNLPGDLVHKACREWLLEEKWLPTVAELIARMEPELTKRHKILEALHKPRPETPASHQIAPQRMQAADVDAILRKHGVGKSDPCPADVAQASPGLSQAQIEAAKAENQAEYWLKLMGAG